MSHSKSLLFEPGSLRLIYKFNSPAGLDFGCLDFSIGFGGGLLRVCCRCSEFPVASRVVLGFQVVTVLPRFNSFLLFCFLFWKAVAWLNDHWVLFRLLHHGVEIFVSVKGDHICSRRGSPRIQQLQQTTGRNAAFFFLGYCGGHPIPWNYQVVCKGSLKSQTKSKIF